MYRNTVYGYPWYTDVRKTLEDPAYADWYFKFVRADPLRSLGPADALPSWPLQKPEPPWTSKKCDSAQPSLCSDFYHSQEQSPGYPHGDGDCAAPGCDCGKVPCGALQLLSALGLWNSDS